MLYWEVRRWLKNNRWRLYEVLGAIAIAALLTWPMIAQPTTAALGSQDADGMKHLWTLWWMRASVWDYGDFPFSTDLINYPTGMDLYPIEPLNGFLALMVPWMNLIALSNFLAFFNITLTGIIGCWFGRVLSGSKWGGIAAGVLLECSSVMAFFVHVGVGELNHLWWLPLGLGCLIQARRTMDWKWFLYLSLCLIGAMLSCFYLGFFLAFSVLIWSILTIWASKETPKLLMYYVLAAVLSVSVVLPITRSFSNSYKSGDIPNVSLESYLFQNHGQPITDPPSARLELQQLIEPNRKPEDRKEAAYSGGRYIGFLSLILALVGLVRRPKEALPWLVVGSVGILFACGSYFTLNGVEVKSNGIRLVMPSFWLNRILGYYAEPLNFPVRYLAMTSVALAAMASLAVKNWKWSLVVPAAALEVIVLQMLAWPWQTFSPREASVLESLRGVDDLALIDFALVARSDMENRYNSLSTQIVHGKRINGVPLERIEFFARDGYYFIGSLKLFRDLKPIYENRGGMLGTDYRPDLAILQDAGFGWLLVSYRSGAEQMPSNVVQQLTNLCGKPFAQGRGLGVWRLPLVEYTPEELKLWKGLHQTQLQKLRRITPGMAPPLK
ncbi:MAG: hypothetical protein VX278_11865 [Myxococcota bacterium]|nr:hypothetical protein [Myxococcota bacterium]